MNATERLEEIRARDKDAGNMEGWTPTIRILLEHRRFLLTRLEEAERHTMRLEGKISALEGDVNVANEIITALKAVGRKEEGKDEKESDDTTN